MEGGAQEHATTFGVPTAEIALAGPAAVSGAPATRGAAPAPPRRDAPPPRRRRSDGWVADDDVFITSSPPR